MLEIKNVTKIFNKGTVNEKVALDDFSLTLEDGDFVTVIGGNGSGKSTMMNAIAGVWPVDEGRIVIDGIDVTKLPEHKRAKYLGRVFQDPMTGTAATMGIEENLALAKRRGKSRSLKTGITKKEREEYKELLKSLDLSLEERMTSKVGLLSGGQRQRLTIARALVKKPEILILDDSLSALDFATDAALRKALAGLEGETTTFLVSQRVAGIRQADKILVLDNGELAGSGTHDELMKSCEVYREIYFSQFPEDRAKYERGEM